MFLQSSLIIVRASDIVSAIFLTLEYVDIPHVCCNLLHPALAGQALPPTRASTIAERLAFLKKKTGTCAPVVVELCRSRSQIREWVRVDIV
jgi:hypothetical protein